MNGARQGDGQECGAEEAQFRRLGAAFNQGGARYERLRPGYPSDAVDWLLGGIRRGSRVADIGAGTGKFTATLFERGLDVIAIDPSLDMLAQLAQRPPGLTQGR